jgi:CYTH domain-containing protein
MALEIELKFLVQNSSWKGQAEGVHYRQGYLSTNKSRTVRVRTINDKAFLTIKGISIGATRKEFEYEIPFNEGLIMLDELCEKPIIEKIRYKIKVENDLVWEIDEFLGENKGLIVAEIELQHEEQSFIKPDWLGKEVTTNPKFYNSSLVKFPFYKW